MRGPYPDDMTTDLEALARTIHALVAETAARQVSREIAHLAEIEVDDAADAPLEAPAGHRAPASGAVATHVVARSRDIPAAAVEMSVAVWVAADPSAPTFLLTRADDERSLTIALDDVRPEVTPHLRAQVNDFVAVIIAHMVARLNVAMQRTYLHEPEGDVAEYEGR
jgi:hypothetical protein